MLFLQLTTLLVKLHFVAFNSSLFPCLVFSPIVFCARVTKKKNNEKALINLKIWFFIFKTNIDIVRYIYLQLQIGLSNYAELETQLQTCQTWNYKFVTNLLNYIVITYIKLEWHLSIFKVTKYNNTKVN